MAVPGCFLLLGIYIISFCPVIIIFSHASDNDMWLLPPSLSPCVCLNQVKKNIEKEDLWLYHYQSPFWQPLQAANHHSLVKMG